MDLVKTLSTVEHLTAALFKEQDYLHLTAKEKAVLLHLGNFDDVWELMEEIRSELDKKVSCSTSGDKKRFAAVKSLAKKSVKEFSNEGGVRKNTNGQDMILPNGCCFVAFNNPLPPSIPRSEASTFEAERFTSFGEIFYEGTIDIAELEVLLKQRKQLHKQGCCSDPAYAVLAAEDEPHRIMVNLEYLIMTAKCIEEDNREVKIRLTDNRTRAIVIKTQYGQAVILPIKPKDDLSALKPDYIIR